MKASLALVLGSLAFTACMAGGKPEVDDDFSGITDEKADAFSKKMTIVATLADPVGSVAIDYTAKPIYRAIKLHGAAGDWVKLTVTPDQAKVPGGGTPPGDPVAFLLDSRFRVVAKNDDASAQTHDAQIVTQLKKSGTFYLVVRDYAYASVRFDAELQLARASGDPVADANAWFQLFFVGDAYDVIQPRFAVAMSEMPQAARADADGFFKTDVGGGTGYAIPYDGATMYFLVGVAEEAYDVRPYDADGNPICDTAIGGDATDITFSRGKTP